MDQPINCPSCGAALKLKYHASKMVVCNYCGQTSFLNADRWAAQGDKTVLADYGSILAVGRTGKIKDKPFTVLGRLRVTYPGGFWDEWWLQKDDSTVAWLQEDEGDFTLFTPVNMKGMIPDYPSVRVGQQIQLPDYPFFVMEKSPMKVQGGEGELPFQVMPGQPGAYVEGVAKGKPMSIEYLADETTLNRGTPVALSELKMDKQPDYV